MRTGRSPLALIAAVGIVVAAAAACSRPTAARDAFPVPASVRVLRDIVYARYGQRQLKADLYLPSDAILPETMQAATRFLTENLRAR